MLDFNSNRLLVSRSFSGLFEISKYIRELLGDDDLSNLPAEFALKAVIVETHMNRPHMCPFYFAADSDVSIKLLKKDNNKVAGVLRCGSENFSFDLNVDLFHDVRRVEECGFTDDLSVIRAYLDNSALRVSVLIDRPVKPETAQEPEADPEVSSEEEPENGGNVEPPGEGP